MLPFYLSTGPPSDASFEAELLARTRHCQLFMLNYDDKLDYWDSQHILQRAHFKPYRIAGFDAHGASETPKTYTLESLMRQNGVNIL